MKCELNLAELEVWTRKPPADYSVGMTILRSRVRIPMVALSCLFHSKHLYEAMIEFTKKTLARRQANSVQTDISRVLIIDIGRKRQVRTSSDRH